MKQKNKIKITIAGLLLICIAVGGWFLLEMLVPCFKIQKTEYIYINTSTTYDELLEQVEQVGKIKNEATFEWISKRLKYHRRMIPGRYEITPEMNLITFTKNLLRGAQTPCKLTFNNIRLKQDFAHRISEQLMFSESELLEKLNDSIVCADLGFTTETILCMFIPNTYEMYWTITVDKFLSKMKSEYDKFWTLQRLELAEAIPLSAIQASILASIVEEETAASKEYSMVAGLYINRLKQNMPLQADPTVKFAVGDFSLRRILSIHLERESPYNTYQNTGLPPGPIRIPSIKGIDSVLNYAHHDYLYMCAKEDFSGTHNFAKTFSEHTKNAAKYRDALNRNNIK